MAGWELDDKHHPPALLEVLDAQRNYRETYRLSITSRANYWRSVYKFSSAIGKQVLPHDEHPKRRP